MLTLISVYKYILYVTINKCATYVNNSKKNHKTKCKVKANSVLKDLSKIADQDRANDLQDFYSFRVKKLY